MIQLRETLKKINAWQIRIITLAFLVVFVGSGSQFLANAFAAGIEPEALVQQVTPLVTQGPTSVTHSKMHITIRRAGIDTIGGYTVPGRR